MASPVRCSQGHYYDPIQHSACPYCTVPPGADPTKTRVIRPEPTPAAAPDPGVTQVLHRQPTGIRPVVGWLVCMEGPDRGRDFRLHSEKNFIGRAPTMDVAVTGDATISREKHAVVSFEPRKRAFWLLPGEASGLVYLNEDVVNTPTVLKPRDVIQLGSTKLLFVPFCDERFEWS
jgi:hypothetical protein